MVTGAYALAGMATSRVHFTEENKGRYTFKTSAIYRVYEKSIMSLKFEVHLMKGI